MISLQKIWINALFEIKILLRGWFFRIFAGLSLVLLFFVNLIFFSEVTGIPRIFNGISSFFPYANLTMLNLVQCVILVFLATDIIKRDKKINTNQVYYIRSMTNAEYLTGKALGLFCVFAGLNFIVLLMSVIYQLIFSDINFNWLPFILYPLLISLPAIIFTLGFSFLLMHIIKNQAVVIIVILGYYSLILFYLGEKFYNILDFFSGELPLIYSDFTGLTHLNLILHQRSFYVILGLVFLFLSILLFDRLYQSQLMKRILSLFILIGVIISLILGYNYISFFLDSTEIRQRIGEINKKYVNEPTVNIQNCILDLKHSDNIIEVKAKIRFINSKSFSLDEYFFSLNPGLKVEKIKGPNSPYQFNQGDHILTIRPQSNLPAGQRDSIEIYYNGKIDERFCYQDIDEKKIEEEYRIWMYKIDKKYAFISRDFLLLDAESNWYPIAGLLYGIGFPKVNKKDFIDFKLTVHTDENMTAVSQGKVTNPQKGNFFFSPEHRLPQISLIIAPYKEKSIIVDSIKYSLYTLPEHNYFENYFTEIDDTIKSLIKEAKQDYEHKIGLDYPFAKLNVIEVPIQFFAYPRIWTVSSMRIQPEMVLMPEGAVYLFGADFKSFERRGRRRSERNQETQTDKEKQVEMFKRFINSTFTGDFPRRRFIQELMKPMQPHHNIFPNYYTYSNHFYSDSLALLNLALESYFYNKVGVKGEIASWFSERLTTGEEVSRALNGKSLKEHLEDSTDNEWISDIMKIKGAHLIKLIESELDLDKLHNFLCSSLLNNRFALSEISNLTKDLQDKFGFNIIPYFNDWYTSKKIPGFIIREIDMFKVLDNDRIRYQVIFKISNPENIVGLTDIRFRFGRSGRYDSRSGVEEPWRVIKLKPKEAKEVGIVLDEEPSTIYMNPMIAFNIPLVYAFRFEKTELKKNYKPFDSERVLDYDLNLLPKNEIIIDNEDSTFTTKSDAQKSILQRLIHGDNANEKKEFDRFRFWSPPDNWDLVKSTGFFGKYIQSAEYIKAGDGEKRAQWETQLSESGHYSVYTNVIKKTSFGRKNIIDENFGEFHYVVYHDDGEEETIVDFKKVDEGWYLLGSYYFSGGLAKVELTNKTNGSLVIADAVKFVKN